MCKIKRRENGKQIGFQMDDWPNLVDVVQVFDAHAIQQYQESQERGNSKYWEEKDGNSR